MAGLALAVSACGGGGSGSSQNGGGATGGGGVTSNSAPTFTSATSATTDTGTQQAFYAASASDADGDTISYSISGGADADQFVISPRTGSLALRTASGDVAGSDFDVQLQASDGRGGTAQLNLAVRVNGVGGITITVPPPQGTISTVRTDGQFYAFADGDSGEEVLRFDFYRADDNATNRPLVVLAHGGGFVGGRRQEPRTLALYLVAQGFAVASIDYRLLGNSNVNADQYAVAGIRATHDMFAAVRFFRANATDFSIDPNRIFAAGVSAGGVIAATAASLDANDAIGNASIADFLNANGGVFGNVGEFTSFSSEVSGALSVAGAVLDLQTIDSSDAPMSLAHFEFDSVVPCGTGAEGALGTGLVVSGSCAIQPRLDAVGLPNTFFLLSGQTGHTGFSDDQVNIIAQDARALFLN